MALPKGVEIKGRSHL